MSSFNSSRRDFMKWSGGCASLSSTAILSQLMNLQLTSSAVAQTGGQSDYKALVCVFLLGGVDSFNMIAPYEQQEYDDYAGIRTNLALNRGSLLPVNTGNGRQIGVHPNMPNMRDLYNAGDAAILANVGSLVFPTDKTEYQNKSVKLPLGLFSHSDLIQHWQTSVPQSRSQVTGWGGRMADMLNASTNSNSNVAMNIALNGLNVFQTGTQVVPYVVNRNGATLLSGYGANNAQDRIYTKMLDYMYPQADSTIGQNYSDLLQQTLSNTKRVSIEAAEGFQAATNVDMQTVFPEENRLGDNLKMVAKTIAGRQDLGQQRQIFFVSAGGWDHHDEVLENQVRMLGEVDAALKSFYDATVELGVADKVTTFTASDFGRTLSSNGNGSDHAWGGNHFVMGGAVNGGSTYGDYPDTLALGNSLDVGRGRLIPQLSVDEYNAELAMWFGVQNNTELEDVLPNIRNFYGSGASANPIGFLPG